MPAQPIIAPPAEARSGDDQRIAADGATLSLHEWRGSGPPQLHVHHEDDEAWHVLEGTVTFRFAFQVFAWVRTNARSPSTATCTGVPTGVPSRR